MQNMLKEFRDFIAKGNMIELAVAVVLATFFAPIVTALVDGIFMNIIAAVFGQPDFHSIRLKIRGEKGIDATYLEFGDVINATVTFIIVGFVLFLVVKAYNKIKQPEAAAAGLSEVDLLTEIRDQLKSR